MDNNGENGKLNDELLDQVSGGESLWGSATGAACTQCGFKGPHQAEIIYTRVDNVITYQNTVIHCGNCGAIF